MHFISSLLTLLLLVIPAAKTTYTNPFAYCAAVGNIDVPDARYTGEKVPMVIARGLQKIIQRPIPAAPRCHP